MVVFCNHNEDMPVVGPAVVPTLGWEGLARANMWNGFGRPGGGTALGRPGGGTAFG